MEFMWLPMNIKVFKRLLVARKVEARLGIVEFELTQEHLEALRDLASRMPPEIPPI